MRFVQNIQVNSKICIYNYPQTVKEFLDTDFLMLVEDPVSTRMLYYGCWIKVAGYELRISIFEVAGFHLLDEVPMTQIIKPKIKSLSQMTFKVVDFLNLVT